MADTNKMRFLRRFPESKHEQIQQLMSYIQLCGVTGKDLVSIGGYLDRSRKSETYKHTKERIDTYVCDGVITPIGKDNRDQMPNRFKFKTINGTYQIVNDGWDRWSVTSNSTKVRKDARPTGRDWPAHLTWGRRQFYDMVLDIADGNFKLDF